MTLRIDSVKQLVLVNKFMLYQRKKNIDYVYSSSISNYCE